MASDSLSVSGLTPLTQPTGSTSPRTHTSPETQPNGLTTGPKGRTDTQHGVSAHPPNRSESGRLGQTDEAKNELNLKSELNQGVAATDTEKVEKLAEAVDKINEMMQQGRQMLTFQLDEESGRMVVRVIDSQTNEVIRQIPSEETLKFAKYVDGLVGLIFNKKA